MGGNGEPGRGLMRSFAKANIAQYAMTLLAALAWTLSCTLAGLGAAAAADYPNRQITLVVPYPPAGGVDAMARVVAMKLSEAFKQQVMVENRGGGGGTIGTRAVIRAQPDG